MLTVLPPELVDKIRRDHINIMAARKRDLNQAIKALATCDGSNVDIDQVGIRPSLVKTIVETKIKKYWLSVELNILSPLFTTLVRTFRSPSLAGRSNLQPTLIHDWVTICQSNQEINDRSYIENLVDWEASVSAMYWRCNRDPEYREYVKQTLQYYD